VFPVTPAAITGRNILNPVIEEELPWLGVWYSNIPVTKIYKEYETPGRRLQGKHKRIF